MATNQDDNELTNPGFESAIGSEWSIQLGAGTIVRVTTPINTGGGAARFTPTGAGAGILAQDPATFTISKGLRVYFGGFLRQNGTVNTSIVLAVLEGDLINTDKFGTQLLRVRANGDIEYLRADDRVNLLTLTVLGTNSGKDFTGYVPIQWQIDTTEDQSDVLLVAIISADGGTAGAWFMDDMWLGLEPMPVPLTYPENSPRSGVRFKRSFIDRVSGGLFYEDNVQRDLKGRLRERVDVDFPDRDDREHDPRTEDEPEEP